MTEAVVDLADGGDRLQRIRGPDGHEPVDVAVTDPCRQREVGDGAGHPIDLTDRLEGE